MREAAHFLDRLLNHFELLDLGPPAPERGDVGGDGGGIDALSGEDLAILPLVAGNFNRSVYDEVQSLLIDGLAIALVVRLTGVQNQLIQLVAGNMIVVGIGAALTYDIAGIVNLIHISQ